MSQVATTEPAVNKYNDPQANPAINVKVVWRSPPGAGDEVFFKIALSTKLYKLHDAFASKIGKDAKKFRLLYDGKRIDDDDTPGSLDMEEDDIIGAEVHQTGGGYETT